jgi:hypothetical protein
MEVGRFGRGNGHGARMSDLELAFMTSEPMACRGARCSACRSRSPAAVFRVDLVDWAALGRDLPRIVERGVRVIQEAAPAVRATGEDA